MAQAARLTNIQQEVCDFVKARGPIAKVNWSEMLTTLDHDRRKAYSTKRLHKAVDDMNQMTPCRMKLTHGTSDYGSDLEAV